MDGRPGVIRLPPLILVIEDDVDTREMYEYILRDSGFRIAGARHAQQGYDVATASEPDAIMTDISMPGPLDVFSMTRLLHANPKTRHIPIIALTGYDEAMVHAAGRFLAVLTKPVNPEEIVAAIQAALRHVETLRSRAGRWHARTPASPRVDVRDPGTGRTDPDPTV